MSLGPGKYDDACSVAREAIDAELVILVVMNGNRGNGFSIQCIDPRMARSLPQLLRAMADDIEKDTQ